MLALDGTDHVVRTLHKSIGGLWEVGPMHHHLVAAPNDDPKLAPQLVAKLAVHEQPLQCHHGQLAELPILPVAWIDFDDLAHEKPAA